MCIKVEKVGLLKRFVNFWISQIFNRLLAGRGFFESPQQTHRGNYRELTSSELASLSEKKMVFHQGDPRQCDSHYRGFPMCHAPIFGGWTNYYVLEPTEKICWDWHVGWIVNGKGYVSRISIGEEVRMLGGNRDTKWFALGNDGQQKKLVCRRQGKIGDGSYLGLIPLL